jgi:uncharacterized phage protein gp47/JayE
MTEYLDIPFESDPDALAQEGFDYLQAQIPNWQPAEGNFDVWLIRAIGRIAAEVQDIATSVPTTIFRYAGANLFNLPPIDALPAVGQTTWTMADNAGYTIPAGTTVGVKLSGDTLIAFQTVEDVIIPPGSTATAAGEVQIQAVNPGSEGTGLTSAIGIELIDSLANVNTIVLTDPTTGGIDAETDEEYLNRLTLELTLLTPRPIIPSDFSALALSVPGVHRALALDGYDPNTGTFDNERMIAMALLDEDGEEVSADIQLAVFSLLDSSREVNFVVSIMDPTYTAVDVTYAVKTEPTFTDVDDVNSRVAIAIEDYLNPANWGLPSTGDSIEWIPEDTVRYLKLGEVINNVQGVRYIISLDVGLSGGAQTATDQILPGAAPLPTPGTIAGSAVL